jgi:hypothetical protein
MCSSVIQSIDAIDARVSLPEGDHISISPQEAADRLSIREPVEAYAHCADRRDARGQMSLFTADMHFAVYMNTNDPKPSQELHSREALAPVFADLNKYEATTHFVRQSTIFTLTSDRATGEAYCLAHHVTVHARAASAPISSIVPASALLLVFF